GPLRQVVGGRSGAGKEGGLHDRRGILQTRPSVSRTRARTAAGEAVQDLPAQSTRAGTVAMTTNNTPPGQTMTDAGGDDHDTVATQTLTQYGTARLWALCDGAGASTLSATVCEVFARMLQPWGVQPVGHAPRYRSNIADDEAPFELSVAFSSGAPEIQFYVEPQGETPTLESNMRAGLALVGKLEADFHVCVERLRAVADLFFPAAPQDPFTI